MRERRTIFIVYKYLTNDGNQDPSYYLIRVFDDLGHIERDELESCFAQCFPELDFIPDGVYVGPFSNLTVLNKFAFSLCEKLDADRICLLSTMEYNGVIDHVDNIIGLHDELVEASNVIENIEKEERGKSLLRKFLRT